MKKLSRQDWSLECAKLRAALLAALENVKDSNALEMELEKLRGIILQLERKITAAALTNQELRREIERLKFENASLSKISNLENCLEKRPRSFWQRVWG